MSTENEIEVNDLELFESLLGTNFDDIEDLPDFVVPPIGDFMIRVEKCEVSKSKDKTQGVIKLIGKIESTIQLANEGDTAPVEGSLTGSQYQGKMGIQRFKKIFGDVRVALGLGTPTELIEALNGTLLAVTIGHRADAEKVDPNTGKPVIYAEWKTVLLGE